ncbi:hypothetical protein V8C34DRAFT_118257 [Trichoderma compactum]
MELASCTEHQRHVSARRRVSRCEMMRWAGRRRRRRRCTWTAWELSSAPARPTSLSVPIVIDGDHPIIRWACEWRACQASFPRVVLPMLVREAKQIPRQRQPCS